VKSPRTPEDSKQELAAKAAKNAKKFNKQELNRQDAKTPGKTNRNGEGG
jgi:hypothetical protein